MTSPALRRLLADQLGGMPKAFWWLWLGTLVNRAGTFIEPFFVLYLTGPRHVDLHTVGLILTAWGLGSTISQPFGGYLTDRFGRRPTLGFSLAATAGLLLALSVVRGVWPITVAVFVLGLVADVYRPASAAAIIDLIAEPQRVRAFALQFWAVNLGFSVAAVSAGLLLDHLGFGLLFVLDAATTLAFGMLALRFVPETRPQTQHEAARPLDPLRLLRADRLAATATLLVLVYAVLYSQVNLTLPLAVKDAGLSPSVYGYAIAINGILIVVGQPLSLAWMERTSRRVTLPIGMGLVGGGVALTGLCNSSWQFAGTVVVWTTGEIMTAGSFQAIVAALAPEHMRGRYSGAVGLAWGGAGLVAPLLSTSVYALSPGVLWAGCLLAGLVAGLGQRWILGRLDSRTAARSTDAIAV